MNLAVTQTRCESDSYERCSVFGAALVSTEFYDSSLCLHGPQGCVQAIREASAIQNRECEYSQTCMSQKDTIFGGEKTLISYLKEALEPYDFAGPKIIVSACTPEIIGDNVQDVIDRVNPRLPVVGVCGGFRGDHCWSINETILQLVKKFADPYARPEHDLVNLIGNVGGSRHWRADLFEMKRLLECLGLKVNVLACNSSLKNLQLASNASATLLLTPEIGRQAAEYLNETFDCKPVVSPLGPPLGLRGTEVWLRNVASELGISPAILNSVLDSEEREVRIGLRVGLKNMVFIEKTAELKKLPVAIVAEGTTALAWARFLAEELEAAPCVVALRTAIGAEEYDDDLLQWLNRSKGHTVLENASVLQVREAIKKERPQLVLGSSIEAELVSEIDPVPFFHIAHPNNQYVTINEVPVMGYRGILQSTEALLNLI